MTRSILLFCAALTAAPVWADDAAMLRCRVIAEGVARLACYDAIALDGIGSRAGWGAPLPGAPSAAPGAAPGAAPAPPSPTANFGFEGKVGSPGGPLERLESRIPGRFDGWEATTTFTLANGQVWAVADGSRAYYELSDPKVVITRGAFGALFMEVEGVAQAPRVKRLR